MKRSWMVTGACLVLALGAVSIQADAQGRGRGGQCGMGQGGGQRGMGRAGGQRGAQAGTPGGWWTRVTPTTEEQKAFVGAVTSLHARIRSARVEANALRAAGADEKAIVAAERTVTGLRSELAALTSRNAALQKEMGVPAGAGVCDGTGARGAGAGAGSGYGRGAGQGRGRGVRAGLRDGTGPNPNCPLK